jgi:thiamine monophosphate synthase
MLADLEALVPPTVMAVFFIALVRAILRAQNPQRRAEAKAREKAAEAADPRINRVP